MRWRIGHGLRGWAGGLLAVISLMHGFCAAAQDLAYTTTIEWTASKAAQAELAPWARRAFKNQTDPVASLGHLRRRIQRDSEFFRQSMRSLGYFGGRIDHRLNTTADPVALTYTLEPGEPYTVGEVSLQAPMASPGAVPLPPPDAIGLTAGIQAKAEALNAADSRLITQLRNAGFPFAAISHERIVVDHARSAVDVTIDVAPGPYARFGPVSVEGTADVAPSVVRAEVPWDEGAEFKASALNQLQSQLYRRDLFSLVRVKPGNAVTPEGALPITVSVVERKHRTISAGVQFESDDGLGARLNWETRNHLGLGRRLTVGTELSQRKTSLDVTYEIPHFRRSNQTLDYFFEAGREDTDAFERVGAETEVFVERRVRPRLGLGAGLGLRWSSIDAGDQDDDFLLGALPLRADLDYSNDRLDPTKGYRVQAEVTPYLNFTAPEAPFIRSDLTVSAYWPFNEDASWVLAGRLGAGLLAGAARSDIPKDLLFFAGGGGSVRGYEYQHAGPLDEDGDPIGGKSVIEGSIELRRRFNEQFGAVAFLDAGTVYDTTYPDFSETLRAGAGVGLRYFTPLGPLRFDVAVPLNKRESDESFQFYLSIGQAF